jgi:hypothetical protein
VWLDFTSSTILVLQQAEKEQAEIDRALRKEAEGEKDGIEKGITEETILEIV